MLSLWRESRHHSVATKITKNENQRNLFPAGSVSGGGGSVGLTGVSSGRGGGVDSLTRVGHLGHESVGVVGGVGGGLDPAVGQSDGEGAADVASSVLGLGLPEVGLAVVVGHAVLIGVRLGWQLLLCVRCRGAVGRGASGNCQGGCQKE